MIKDKYLEKYVGQSRSAIMFFACDQLIASNHSAEELQRRYGLDPCYLRQIAQNGKSSSTAGYQVRTNVVTIPTKEKESLHLSLCYRLLDQEEDVYSLTIRNLQHEEQLSAQERQHLLTRYVNRAHEKERQQISQDLHDSIAQGVYSAIMGVRRFTQGDLSPAEQQETSQAIEIQLQETLTEIKEMALDIRPAVLDSFGLVPAIKALAKRLQANSGVIINVLAVDEQAIQLTSDEQSVLYRVCQEAINNALRHAHPSEITVLLSNHPHVIQMQVLDDGDGFNLKKNAHFNGHSLGLMNMKERVTALNGVFEISSHPYEGTTVTVKFPLNTVR